ncbi:PQQ-dependent sugar dehydrogenase [Caballeronia novacaledonica]|nr:sorbosone dehydrogenase family protein [Caballeronia novacaledonica]
MAIALMLASGAAAADDYAQGFGPNPTLPAPHKALMPTVNIAPAKPWTQGQKPTAAPGFDVTAFGAGLDHPRWVATLPNGDVLVAESNGPAKHDENAGIKGFVMKKVQKRAGAAVESPDRIMLLRDADGDGVAETRTVFIDKLHSPFGMALVGDELYVADTDAILRFKYETGATQITTPGEKFMDLPAGDINHHWTKNIIASRDGKKLYVTIGSNSNAAENGIDAEKDRAAIMEVDIESKQARLFATGLRNPNGMSWQPQSGALWTVVNERDELGDELVPDYLTSVKDGAFYGWPYSYYGQHVDDRVKPQRADLVQSAILPDYAIGAHTASLGLAFYDGKAFAERYRNGAFIGQHGSWNRKPRSGYKVIFVPFDNGKPSGPPEDILTGFVSSDGHALGRPVGVAVDGKGALLVADDVGNTVWRVAPASK